MDKARCYRMSDRALNRQFSRRWREPSPPPTAPRPAPPATDAEPGMATLLRWHDEWRARRVARPARKEAAR